MKKRKEIITKSAVETREAGKILAKEILKNRKNKGAVVLALNGDLGTGKTTFLQGFAKGLGIKEKILSPTFVIMKRFQILNPKFQKFYHIDCYRIQKPKEIFELGFKKIISNPKNIIAIEWAGRIKKIIPEAAWIRFKFIDKNKRALVIH
jgi:tRNA threonylcarbamoyladenosine biosynthesis protein TsaE